MKTFIVIIVCSMLVLEGCYSYSALGEGGSVPIVPPPEEAIVVHTKDGRDLELEAFHFLEVRKPSNCVYGVGERAAKDSSRFVPFRGTVLPIARRTENYVVEVGRGKYRPAARFVFTLQDSSNVRMEEVDCIFIDSAQGIGFWYVIKQPDGKGYVGKISFDDIVSIEAKEFSTIRTVVLATFLGPFVVLTIAWIWFGRGTW